MVVSNLSMVLVLVTLVGKSLCIAHRPGCRFQEICSFGYRYPDV